jgi:hypothetical protein
MSLVRMAGRGESEVYALSMHDVLGDRALIPKLG